MFGGCLKITNTILDGKLNKKQFETGNVYALVDSHVRENTNPTIVSTCNVEFKRE